MSKFHSIVAISNPRSGRNKKGGFQKFSEEVKQYSEITHLVTSQESELLSVLQQCEDQEVKIIIVNGGDGTLLKILTFIKSRRQGKFNPRLVLLKSGTTSMAFGDVGCKGSHPHVLQNVVDFINGDQLCLKEKSRQVLHMSLPDENKTVCGMFFGAGVIYNGILYCRQNMHTRGIKGEAGPSMTMIRYLFDWVTVNKLTTSTQANIQCDKSILLSGDFTIITATTLRRLLAGMFPFWGAARSGQHFFFTSVKKNAPKPIRSFIKIMRRKSPSTDNQSTYYQSNCPEKITINIMGGFTLDGELFGEEGVSTKIDLSTAGEIKFLTT